MFVQIWNGCMINMRNVRQVRVGYAHEEGDDDPWVVIFELDNSDDPVFSHFQSEEARDRLFQELMRKVGCLEWKNY